MLRTRGRPPQQMTDSIELAALEGDLDLERAPELRRALGELVERSAQTVVVDLRRVSFLDSSGLGALIDARRAAHARGSRFLLVKPNPLIWRTAFVTTGLTRMFEAIEAPPQHAHPA